jgi:hypothetical protein
MRPGERRRSSRRIARPQHIRLATAACSLPAHGQRARGVPGCIFIAPLPVDPSSCLNTRIVIFAHGQGTLSLSGRILHSRSLTVRSCFGIVSLIFVYAYVCRGIYALYDFCTGSLYSLTADMKTSYTLAMYLQKHQEIQIWQRTAG